MMMVRRSIQRCSSTTPPILFKKLQKSSVALCLYVPELESAYRRALKAGATSIAEPAEQYHGDSLAILQDQSGGQWYLAYASVILDDDQARERRQKEGK